MQKSQQNNQSLLELNQEDFDEIIKKCIPEFEKWMQEEENEFFTNCLDNLGLCVKKGMDDQEMLYPIKQKERKLDPDEFQELLERVYIKTNRDQFINLNDETKNEIQSIKQKNLKSIKKKNASYSAKKKTPTEISLFKTNSSQKKGTK